jgi:ABC-type multidrug transport system fused ATPase/permease subunit
LREDTLYGWPLSGAIIFSNVSASYHSSLEPVLKDICLEIESGEKLAICGRTGSGKSSLIAALLRMLELSSGTITLDRVDIAHVARKVIRDKFNTLTQDPVFLHGTIRENLDIHAEEPSDSALEQALQAVGIRNTLLSDGKQGLEEPLLAEKLSHGTKQLFCLARAIVASKQRPVLLLDEITSHVDGVSEDFMRAVIQEHFHGKTVIEVVHKLDAILDFDHVVVLDRGSIVEYGVPSELLKQDSHFRRLHSPS